MDYGGKEGYSYDIGQGRVGPGPGTGASVPSGPGVPSGANVGSSAAHWDTSDPPMLPTGFRELCRKYLHEVIAYCSVFWSFGMCVAFLGPTLLDLGCQTASDMKTISWVFFSQLTCSLIGSVLAGYLAQR